MRSDELDSRSISSGKGVTICIGFSKLLMEVEVWMWKTITTCKTFPQPVTLSEDMKCLVSEELNVICTSSLTAWGGMTMRLSWNIRILPLRETVSSTVSSLRFCVPEVASGRIMTMK